MGQPRPGFFSSQDWGGTSEHSPKHLLGGRQAPGHRYNLDTGPTLTVVTGRRGGAGVEGGQTSNQQQPDKGSSVVMGGGWGTWI